jgi:sugar phosphate isomerase/epimerase
VTAKLALGLAQGAVPVDATKVDAALAARLAEAGVDAIVTHFAQPATEIAAGLGGRIRRALESSGVYVAQATAYNPDLVGRPDDKTLKNRIAEAAEAANALGARMLLTGCGSHHPSFPYGAAASNHTPETEERLVATLSSLVPIMQGAGIPLALECHTLTTLGDAPTVRRILDAVDSPWMLANFDPVNLLGDVRAVFASGKRMRQDFDTLRPRLAPSAHLKDLTVRAALVVHIDEVPLGEGELDLDAFFDCCLELPENATIVVEHLDEPRSWEALRYAREQATARGIALGR